MESGVFLEWTDYTHQHIAAAASGGKQSYACCDDLLLCHSFMHVCDYMSFRSVRSANWQQTFGLCVHLIQFQSYTYLT